MNNQFVTYEIALALKELGYSEICLGEYYIDKNKRIILSYKTHYHTKKRNSIQAPLWQQAIDFLREKYDIVINIYANASGYLFEMHDSAKRGGTHRYDSGFEGPNEGGCWNIYPEARKQAILKAIEWLV